jgi:hypothetical protein
LEGSRFHIEPWFMSYEPLVADSGLVRGDTHQVEDPNFGSNNSGWVQRITSPWTVWDQYFWNNPPSVTTVNQVVIPQSTSTTSNSELVVTDLVRDMRTSGNNGFHLRLQIEVTYNSRQWAGSLYPDPTRRPKLIVWYH